MSTRVVRILTDDLDGSDADDTVKFGMDGVLYEIDLSLRNSNEFRAMMQRYLDAGRKVGKMAGGPAKVPIPRQGTGWLERAGGPSATVNATYDPAAKEERARVREWARSHGVLVPDRGRISQDVIDAYAAQDPTMMNKYTGARSAAPGGAPTGAPTDAPVSDTPVGSGSSNGYESPRAVPAAAFAHAGEKTQE